MRRNLARTLVAALVAVPVLVAAAPAAQASTCPLVVDASGDGASTLTVGVLGSSDQLDIRSGDIASGATSVVATLRVASLAPDIPTTLGATWDFVWQINNHHYAFTLRRDAFGTYRSTFDGAPSAVPSSVVIDEPNASITWSVARSALPDLATAGQTFDHIAASTAMSLGVTSVNADAAYTTQTYVDQTAGCITAP